MIWLACYVMARVGVFISSSKDFLSSFSSQLLGLILALVHMVQLDINRNRAIAPVLESWSN